MKTKEEFCKAIFKKAGRLSMMREDVLESILNCPVITLEYVQDLYQKHLVQKKSLKEAQYAYMCLVMSRNANKCL